ncbi:hypothetical protein Bca4012_010653 [Brassica carinata]
MHGKKSGLWFCRCLDPITVYIVRYCNRGHVDVVIRKTGGVDVVISKKRGVDVDVAARGLGSVDVEAAVMGGVELGLGVWREAVLRVCEFVKPFSSSMRVDVLLLGEFSVNSCLEKGKFTKLVPRQRRVDVLLLGEFSVNSCLEKGKFTKLVPRQRRVQCKLVPEKGKFTKLVPRQRRAVKAAAFMNDVVEISPPLLGNSLRGKLELLSSSASCRQGLVSIRSGGESSRGDVARDTSYGLCGVSSVSLCNEQQDEMTEIVADGEKLLLRCRANARDVMLEKLLNLTSLSLIVFRPDSCDLVGCRVIIETFGNAPSSLVTKLMKLLELESISEELSKMPCSVKRYKPALVGN